MGECGYPSVYDLDCYATRPPVPLRQSYGRRRHGVAQSLLFLLVSVALCGMLIEACFIYHLYQPDTAAPQSKLISDEDSFTSPSKRPDGLDDILPSKPVAHLTDGQDVVHGKEIMAWSIIAEPLCFDMDYKDGSLLIQKEGFYYVYSKVHFLDSNVFFHSISLKTKQYNGTSISLLQSKQCSKGSTGSRSNSYLGGVFHLRKDDAIFVRVTNTSKILRNMPYENVFGAYMI